MTDSWLRGRILSYIREMERTLEGEDLETALTTRQMLRLKRTAPEEVRGMLGRLVNEGELRRVRRSPDGTYIYRSAVPPDPNQAAQQELF